jgi:outer membrane protein assembly factor BamB
MNRSASRVRSLRGPVIGMLLLFAAAGAAGGAPPPAGPEGLAAAVWPMLGASPSHASFSGFRGPDTNTLAWRFNTNASIDGGVAIDADGTIFFGSGNGRFFAVDQTGRERWSVKNLQAVVGVPALSRRGKVYIATSSGKLYAFDAATGASLWSFHARSPITTSPAVGSDGTIYFGTRAKGLFAVTPQGARAWSVSVDVEASSPAIGEDGTIYVGTTDARLVALAPNGSTRWNRVVGSSPGYGHHRGGHGDKRASIGSPTIGQGRLYVGASDGYVRALDLATGNALWAFRAGAAILSGLSLGPDGAIYFGAADKKVYAVLDAGTQGQLRWAKGLGGTVESTPAVDRTGAVFVGSENGRIYALEPGNGAVRWSFATGRAVQSALAIGIGGRVFAGSGDQSMYAIGEFRGGAACWNDAFIDPTGLSPEELTRRFQILLAACGGPHVNACEATVQGAVNADRFLAAQQIAAQQISPGRYLAVLRDRTRKLAALKAGGAARLCGLVGHDADGDLVPDSADACPGTPPLTATLDNGCPDPTLPAAPSADLIRDGLAKMNLLLDPRCDQAVPEIPALTATVVTFSGANFDDPVGKELWLAFDNNQAPGCGVFYEMEVFHRKADGVVEFFYLVFPQSRGVSKGLRTLAFLTKRDDAGTYGAFTRSKALVEINNPGAVTHYRLRATNYAGVRSIWGPLIAGIPPAP